MNDKVMNELSEGDDANLLDKLKALADETGAESERIKRELYAGELTAEKAVQEFAETCMPLLRDLTQQVFGVQQHAILFRQAASPKIWPEEDDAAEDGLWPEDAQIFKKLLENYRALLANSLEQANDDAIKTAAQKELALITRAIKRVDELTIQDDEGPEQSEGEEEEEQDEDDEDKPN